MFRSMSGRGRDLGALGLTGAAAFAVYVATMFPDVGGGGDSAKFQYLGKVLGTAHPPGYPLYVVLNHLFTWLPVGTLAYRANVMSGCFGALTVMLVYLAIRELGTRRTAAIAGALGLAFGRAFWSKAVVAEVYTLAGALTALALWTALRWGRLRTDRWLFGSVAAAALAFGNHLSILFVAPSLVAYVLLVDWHRAVRPRVIATVLLLIGLGAAQYLFIWLRTVQGAVALEASARSFGDLLSVITARRYAGDMFGYTLSNIASERLPDTVATLGRDLGLAGSILLVAGLTWLFRRKPWEGVLLAGAALGPLVLVLNVYGDMEGFLTAGYVALWMIAGAGAHAIAIVIARASSGAAAVAASLAIVLAVPAVQLRANYAVNDHHRRDFERRYLTALFERLPNGAGILQESYAPDQLILYMMYGEGHAGRGITQVLGDPERAAAFAGQGRELFAFEAGAAQLRTFGFSLEPVTLDEPLHVYLRALPRGMIVLLAARPGAAFGFTPDDAESLRRLGLNTHFYGAERRGLVAIGVVGAAGARETLTGSLAELTVAVNQEIGATGHAAPLTLQASVTNDLAVVSADGVDPVRVRDGLALMVLAPGGQAVGRAAIDTTRAARIPLDMSATPTFRVTAFGRCVPLGNTGWLDISPAAARTITLRLDNYRSYDATATLYLGSDGPLGDAPPQYGGTGIPTLAVEQFDRTPARRAALASALAQDGVPSPAALLASAVVTRIALAVNDDGQWSTTTVTLANPPAVAVGRARVDLDNPRRATVCGVTPVNGR